MQTVQALRPARSASFLTCLLLGVMPSVAQVPAPDAAPPQPKPADDLAVQDPLPGTDPGAAREVMWYAPTAEDWAKPVRIEWERTWDAAVEVARAAQKPILVCINMDGEIASEHYAGVRYRDPAVAALFAPYVCVIASVYRHNPRDYDGQGQRIECPRFEGVTCGEHIAMEPAVYDQFLDQRRISPRHIMVELDGSEVYDVFYAFDTKSVFRSIRNGIVERKIQPNPDAPEDRPLFDRVGSLRARDQAAVERSYATGERETRRALLMRMLELGPAAHLDLLRLAIFGLDVELARLAREALAKTTDPAAVDLIAEALRVPLAAEEREALIATLERLGESDEAARTLAVVHRGLAAESKTLRASDWAARLAEALPLERTQRGGGIRTLTAKLDYSHATLEARPADPEARLELAESFLRLGVDPETTRAASADRRGGVSFTRLLFEDALRAAQEAEELGATGWRVDAALGLAHYYLGDLEAADARAERAARAVPEGETSWHAMATLGLFAEARQRQIRALTRARRIVPPEWITDVHTTYAILAQHPLGTEEQALAHVDFLRRFRAVERAHEALTRGLARFPDAPGLHARLRAEVLEEQGPAGLIPTYERMLAAPDAPRNLPWFAGLAALMAAEAHVRAGDDTNGALAYTRSLADWVNAIAADESNRESADHYTALALMGRGRLALQAGDLDAALADMLESFVARPLAANAVDGLGHYGTANARMLTARLREAERPDDAATVEAALAALPPEALAPPEFELDRPRDDGRGPVRRGPRQQGQ